MKQKDYSQIRPQMHDFKSREIKAKRIIATLNDYLGKSKIKECSVLDVGSSTGIIDSILAKSFNKVYGIDIDQSGIKFAQNNFKKKNLHFIKVSAEKIPFKPSSFEVVICTHVYEHVNNPKLLMQEIYRVLKPKGVCYFAAINAIWPIEPHYNLPFLSYLPKRLANYYVKALGKANKYYENPMFIWQLRKLVSKFKIIDYTEKILSNPKKYSYNNIPIPHLFSKILKYFTPTIFWLLVKK